MKRIVRLTESDLTRIVRRVINEGAGQTTYDKIKNLIATANIGNWWNKSAILDVVYDIKNCEEFLELFELAKKRGYDKPSEWIIHTLKTKEHDKTQSANIVNPISKLGTGITDSEFNDRLQNHLGKWGYTCFKK
jgi:hypothetical protein